MKVGEISAREIAVSGLKAQRLRMNVIANNLANAETTRTPEGGPFRRQLAVFRGEQLKPGPNPEKLGVRVAKVVGDPAPFRSVYDPSHPDANAEGYVAYPNISIAVEMVDLISAQRAYDANIAVLVSDRRMTQKALEIIQR
jgi:flagellar basal-body rod protein FlgC